MDRFKKIIACVFCLLAVQLFSQKVQLDAVLDTSKMRIGEQAKIDIYVTYNSHDDIRIQWPTIGDTLISKVEVVAVSPIDTTFPDKTNSTKIFQHQQVLVSVYDSGYYALPGFKFVINGDTAHPGFTNPLFLEVHTVPTDTSAKGIKDIKPPFDEKFNWKWYLNYVYWGLALLAILVAAILITRYYARKNRQVVQEPEKPKVPAHITALAALEKIKQEQVWKEGHAKAYYSSISETIRAYIEDRFNVNALESTTDEIMKAFRSQVVDRDSKDKLQQLLTLSDLVKFAKMTPIEEEHSFTLQNAFDFVNGTKREDEADFETLAVTNEATQQTTEQPASIAVQQKETSINHAPAAEYSRQESKTMDQSTSGTVTSGKKKISKIKFILVAVLSAFVTWFLIHMAISMMTKNDEGLEQVARILNEKCPVMLDAETRLDNAAVVGENTLQYNYTLLNVSAGQFDAGIAKNQLEPKIIEQVKTNPDMQKLRESKATLKYSYSDRAGTFLFSIKVGPEEYNTYN